MSTSDERTPLVRELPLELAEGDGRTIDARIFPYNEAARVADPPDYTPYEEAFVRGCIAPQVTAAHRVWLNFEHEDGLRGIIGHGAELEEREDGAYASFRVHDNADGNKALQLVRDGLLTAMSAEFLALKSQIRDGVTHRIRVHLDRVSLVRRGAYPRAEVLAVRAEPVVIDVPKLNQLPDDVLDSLGSLGLRVDTLKDLRLRHDHDGGGA